MWSDLAFLLHSRTSSRILKVLQKRKTTKQVTTELGLNIHSVSKTMQKLKARKMIKCLNPRDFSYRIYTITAKGKKTLKQLEMF